MHAKSRDTGRIFLRRQNHSSCAARWYNTFFQVKSFTTLRWPHGCRFLHLSSFMTALILGERLTELRRILVEEAFFPSAWSRASVAHVAGVSPAALARLEKTGAGTAATLAAVLAYYQAEGFNLAWVLTPDNAAISLRGLRDIF